MELSGWGRFPRIQARGDFFETEAAAARLVAAGHSWIAHGAGKSYGDSALNQDVIFTRRFNALIRFDDKQGVIQCAAGMTLAEIIGQVLPRGWFLKVTPGTKLITVGGAIAADVHGKNHHQAGCFSTSVLSFRLMLPDGRVIICSREQNPDLFRATCGGMGLTGLILDASLQLMPVNSAFIKETIIPCGSLDEVIEQCKSYQAASYSVAWLDCFSSGSELGRGLLMLGEHADDGDLLWTPPRALSVPRGFPSILVNHFSARLFNRFYYRVVCRSQVMRRTPLDRFFYPLDRLNDWNRFYGPSGFVQYQFVMPEAAGPEGLRMVLKKMIDARSEPFLAVLKLFGPRNENMLSFPMRGYTLALDFRIQPGLFPLLEALDVIVRDHGGRHYLAKDARLKADVFQRGYPGAAEFIEIRQRYGLMEKINSLQSRRLKI